MDLRSPPARMLLNRLEFMLRSSQGSILNDPRRAVVPLLLVCAAAAHASSFSSGAKGTTSAEFLQLGVGARGEAMGGAYGAVVDGADALYWNPAALSRVDGRAIAAMYAPYLAGSYYDSVQYAQRLGPGGFGAGFQHFSAGAIDQTDVSGAGQGTFTPTDLAFSAGYGAVLPGLGGLAAGASAKYVRSRIATTAQTAAVDAGLLSPAYLEGRFRAAATVSNVGGTLRYDAVRENLPLTFRLGTAFVPLDGLTAAFDLSAPRNAPIEAAFGAEYRRNVARDLSAALRAGYTTASDAAGFSGASFGGGLGAGRYTFDYALVPDGELGLTHRISMGAKF